MTKTLKRCPNGAHLHQRVECLGLRGRTHLVMHYKNPAILRHIGNHPVARNSVKAFGLPLAAAWRASALSTISPISWP